MANSYFKAATVGSVSALALAAASTASAVDMQVGDTTATIGGYTKLDFIYNVNEDLGDTVFVHAVNTGAAEDNEVEGKTRLHARQSRLYLITTTPTDAGDLTTRIEGDFFGDGGNEVVSNSTSFRIRHAYGSWNGILAGQTWSNFMPLIALPSTLDFAGPAGYVFNRQGQVRYTVGGFSVALENPETSLAGVDIDPTPAAPGSGDEFNTGDFDTDPLPDLTAMFQGELGGFKYALSGVATKLETERDGNKDDDIGFGTVLAAALEIGGTTIGGNVGYVDGANRYFYNSAAMFSNGFVDANDEINTVPEIEGLLYVDQALSSTTNALLSVGYSDGDADSEDEATAESLGFKDSTMTVHANIRYTPIERVTYGIEYQYIAVEEYSGADGDANRVQFSASYTF